MTLSSKNRKGAKAPPLIIVNPFFAAGVIITRALGGAPKKPITLWAGRTRPSLVGSLVCCRFEKQTEKPKTSKREKAAPPTRELLAMPPAPSRHASYLSPLSLSRISKQASKQATKRPFSYYTTYIGRSDRALGAASSSVVSSTRGRRRRERDYSATFAQTVTIIYWRNFGFRFELSS